MTQIVRLQILRATTAQRTAYTPAPGEFVLDTDSDTLYIGNGSTAGGEVVTSLGGGEANTATNVGIGGVGVFKQKTGASLEFKNIAAGSSKVLVTDDTGDNEIDIDIDPSEINTSDLNNDANFRNTNQVNNAVDAHANLTNNPHSVTASQVGLGNVDNTSDADKPISDDTQSALDLKYNASNPNGYETPSELNARDTANRARSNHTGTQLASTISDFNSAVYSALDRDYVNTDGQISTTSTAYVQAQTLTYNVPAGGGRYEIQWYAEMALDSGSDDFEFRMQIDNSTTLCEIIWEPQEAGTDNFRPLSGFYEIDLAAGNRTIDMDYATSDGSTATIRRRRIKIQRIA